MKLRLLDINNAIREEFGTLDFTVHIKDKESLDSGIRNALLEMLEENEITTNNQIENAIKYIRKHFEEIQEKYNKKEIIEENWNMIKEYIRKSL